MKNGSCGEDEKARTGNPRKPSILIPYPGPFWKNNSQDIIVYLRPETNGVQVESTLFKVIRNNSEYKKNIKIAYLANLPGDFIIANKIVEKHYSVKLFFTVGGKSAFTPYMRDSFERYFRVSFKTAPIVGAFEALDILKMSYDELFNIWVPGRDVFNVDGQTIKKFKGLYIVNYDIPAILHKNNYKTDIAVMIFRSTLKSSVFHGMILEMAEEFSRENILDPSKPVERVFHYSKSPYEQILDSLGYIYSSENQHIEYEDISFFNYLLFMGLKKTDVLDIIRHPVMHFKRGELIKEENIFLYSEDMDYKNAYLCLSSVVSQPLLVYR